MYPGGALIDGVIPSIGTSLGLSTSMDNADIGIPYGMDYSQQADFFFQVVFVATAMSIVSGAVAGRMKIVPFFLFAVVLTGFIYPIQGYWNWGGGFLSEMGYSDYAGSGTVHLCGAAAALAVVNVLGPRKGKYNSDGSSNIIPGSNIPMAALGVWILWLGWFGFNGGSELVVSNEAAAIAVSQVFLNTNIAAAGGVVATLITSQIVTKKMDITMAMNGAIAGLVAITAAPSAPTAGAALMIGAVGGIIVYFSLIILDRRFGIDDPVGAISAHGVVGIWGVMAVVFTGGSLVLESTFPTLTLKDLDHKLNEIREKKNSKKPSNGQAFKSAHMGWRMILELVIGILIGVLLGFGGASLVLGWDIGSGIPLMGLVATIVALLSITFSTIWQKKSSGGIFLEGGG